MARTNIKPRPPGYKVIQLVRKAKRHNITFKDHRGNPALMSWSNAVGDSSLPPLASWVFYMVNPDVPLDFDGFEFSYGLEDNMTRCRGGEFRYEFFFLPRATAKECVTHFRGETEARGTIWSQIDKVGAALKKVEEGKENDNSNERLDMDDKAQEDAVVAGRLPGLVWSKQERDVMGYVGYHSWLFMYPDADVKWESGTDDLRQVYLVRFDPISRQKKEGLLDPTEHPIHVHKMSARGDRYQDDGLILWMEDRKDSKWEIAANEATCGAMKLGWESW